MNLKPLILLAFIVMALTAGAKKYIISDIDGTVVEPAKPNAPGAFKVTTVSGAITWYRPKPGAFEYLRYILDRPEEFELHFLGGVSKELAPLKVHGLLTALDAQSGGKTHYNDHFPEERIKGNQSNQGQQKFYTKILPDDVNPSDVCAIDDSIYAIVDKLNAKIGFIPTPEARGMNLASLAGFADARYIDRGVPEIMNRAARKPLSFALFILRKIENDPTLSRLPIGEAVNRYLYRSESAFGEAQDKSGMARKFIGAEVFNDFAKSPEAFEFTAQGRKLAKAAGLEVDETAEHEEPVKTGSETFARRPVTGDSDEESRAPDYAAILKALADGRDPALLLEKPLKIDPGHPAPTPGGASGSAHDCGAHLREGAPGGTPPSTK